MAHRRLREANLRIVALRGRCQQYRRHRGLDSECSSLEEPGADDEVCEDDLDEDGHEDYESLEESGEEESDVSQDETYTWSRCEVETWWQLLSADLSDKTFEDKIDILRFRWPLAERFRSWQDTLKMLKHVKVVFGVDLSVANMIDAYNIPLD